LNPAFLTFSRAAPNCFTTSIADESENVQSVIANSLHWRLSRADIGIDMGWMRCQGRSAIGGDRHGDRNRGQMQCKNMIEFDAMKYDRGYAGAVPADPLLSTAAAILYK